MSSFLVFLVGLSCLTWVSVQDWRRHRFNALIPVSAILIITLLYFFSAASFTFGPGLLLNLLLSGILITAGSLRLGDLLPITVYTGVYTSIQSFFTLLMATGLYLYAYPKYMDEEPGNPEWIPFIPAVLTAYLIQALLITA